MKKKKADKTAGIGEDGSFQGADHPSDSNTDHQTHVDQDPHDSAEKQCEDVQSKPAEVNDKYLRLYSEFDNYRRRTAREKVELIRNASEETIKNLLPVIDDFERGLKTMDGLQELSPIRDGFSLILQKFLHILGQQGLVQMKAMGDTFDTDFHEAVAKIPAPEPDLRGKVVDVVEKGYVLNDKVIRFAKVVVGE
ncbi:MAG: nucleotide exchange factor GrpE [Bacteroidetes bacterium]|nr:nucleotide exchange factor GrpE [Bacteroidota bacterium]